MPVTRPVSDLRDKTAEISRICRESEQPVVLKEDGKVDLVLMSVDAYESVQARLELYHLLGEAEEDARKGDQGISVEAMRKLLAQ